MFVLMDGDIQMITVQAFHFSPISFKLGIKFTLILPGSRQSDTLIAHLCCELPSPSAAQAQNNQSVALIRQRHLSLVAECLG